MFDSSGEVRPQYASLFEMLEESPAEDLRRSKQESDLIFLNQGITFTVYGKEEGTERIFPHDLLPRIITRKDWEHVEAGLTQRITALNLFLRDIYHEGRILNDGIVPRELVYSCRHYRREMRGLDVPRRVLRQRLWHRPGALAGWQLRGARRQSPRAQRRFLHASEPKSVEASFPNTVSGLWGLARRSLSAGSAGHFAWIDTSQRLGTERAHGGAAHAGRLQFCVF